LEGVPSSLPALVKATRIQEKVKGIGFEFADAEDAWAKVQEELSELRHEIELNSERVEAEFGDVLFSLVNYARFLNISPENALAMTNQKFIGRFQKMEALISEEGMDIKELDLAAMDRYWDLVKAQE
jgi:XTP/dITP diphosphohydrolase